MADADPPFSGFPGTQFGTAAGRGIEICVMTQSSQPVAEPNDAFRLERCQQRLGYQFREPQLLEAALTHASGADHRLSSNERLEFLGDAILGLVVCEQLFNQFPDQLEGDLTKLKSVVVSRLTCARSARRSGCVSSSFSGRE